MFRKASNFNQNISKCVVSNLITNTRMITNISTENYNALLINWLNQPFKEFINSGEITY